MRLTNQKAEILHTLCAKLSWRFTVGKGEVADGD